MSIPFISELSKNANLIPNPTSLSFFAKFPTFSIVIPLSISKSVTFGINRLNISE